MSPRWVPHGLLVFGYLESMDLPSCRNVSAMSHPWICIAVSLVAMGRPWVFRGSPTGFLVLVCRSSKARPQVTHGLPMGLCNESDMSYPWVYCTGPRVDHGSPMRLPWVWSASQWVAHESPTDLPCVCSPVSWAPHESPVNFSFLYCADRMGCT